MGITTYALSIRQPWAALVVHGKKSIEIRRWPLYHRGRLLIHAAKLIDPRPEGWTHVADSMKSTTERRGGIIGAVEVTGCLPYQTWKAFSTDRLLHLNDPQWFQAPMMYGFVVTHAEILPFRAAIGNVRLFTVTDPTRR